MDADHETHWDEAYLEIAPSKRFWTHANEPSNLGICANADATATAVGSCGDKISVGLWVRDNTLEEVRCDPEGCLFTRACASAMSVLAKGRSIEDALELQPEDVVNELEGIPDDHLHCARLAVNTLGEAIADYYRRESLSEPLQSRISSDTEQMSQENDMQTIVLVSPNVERWSAFAAALKTQGQLSIVDVRSGSQALAAARETVPLAMVVDEDLDGTSGIDLVKQLLQVNAMIHLALASGQPSDRFHEETEGLGLLMQLSPLPTSAEAGKLVDRLGQLTGSL
jgi:nitrogen fixation NifU-like protein